MPTGSVLPLITDVFGETPNSISSMLDQHVRLDQLSRFKVLAKEKKYVNTSLQGSMLTINCYIKHGRVNIRSGASVPFVAPSPDVHDQSMITAEESSMNLLLWKVMLVYLLSLIGCLPVQTNSTSISYPQCGQHISIATYRQLVQAQMSKITLRKEEYMKTGANSKWMEDRSEADNRPLLQYTPKH